VQRGFDALSPLLDDSVASLPNFRDSIVVSSFGTPERGGANDIPHADLASKIGIIHVQAYHILGFGLVKRPVY